MRNTILFILALFLAFSLNAQTYKNKLDSLVITYQINKANKAYNHMAYAKAINKYEKLSSKEQLPDSSKSLLATAYLNVSQTMKSEAVFSSIPTEKINNDALFLYAQSLKYNGKYDEADKIIAQYNKRNPDDSRAQKLLNALPKIEEILSEERYLIEDLDLNSEESDFAPFVYDHQIIFTSARDLDYIIKREYSWKEAPYLNVLKSKIKEDGFSTPKIYATELRSMYHDGPICISADGEELFITRNNFHSFINFKKKPKRGYNNLRILKSVKATDGTWMKPVELSFNSKEYSCGHACLSPDGNKLYFTSDMPGGKGGSDLYCVKRNGDDWGKPMNLGNDINTEGDEMFPFIHKNGQIYFTSNGKLGIGGLDVFVAEPKANGYKVKNMGYPLNSKNDDFGLYLTEDGANGYFASNRPGGKGDDDIYKFSILKKIAFKKGLKGKVINKNTRQAIANAPVIISATNGKKVNLISDTNGMLSGEIDDTPNITTIVNMEDYFPYKGTIVLTEETTEFEILLTPRPFHGIYGSVFLLPGMSKIPDVKISMIPKPGVKSITSTNTAGNFKTRLKAKTYYDLVFTKKGYFTKRLLYSTFGRDTGYVNVNEFMKLELEEAEVGKSVEVKIFYDLGKWHIREDAAVELDDMVQFMKDNPTIKIELGSHTDSRGSGKSNQVLSQKRAQSAVNYMVERGVSKDRIIAKGYGETKLKNHCTDGIKCSEEEHQANRRSEVTVVEM